MNSQKNKQIVLNDETIKALNTWHYMTTPHEHEWSWLSNEIQWEKKYNDKGKLIVDCYGRPKLSPAYYRVDECSKCKETEKTRLN